EHARTIAAKEQAARDHLGETLAREAAARIELAEEAEAQRLAIEAERAGLRSDVARLESLLNQRTWERDAVKRTPEFRFGHLVLNKLKLRSPLRKVEKGLHGARLRLATARLAAERSGLLGGGRGKPRVLSTICWNFPIYSQTFVYQELTQMERRGFELRV